METDLARLKRDLKQIIDPDAPVPAERLDVTDAVTLNDVEIRLQGHFGTPDAGTAVALVHGPERLGVVTRESLGLSGITAAHEVGDGERSTLPGASTQYKLLTFTCRKCAHKDYRMHYDARDLPTCNNDSHGKMELKREA